MKHRLADRIVAWSPWSVLRGIKAVSFEEYCLRERLGYAPALPESLVIGAVCEMGNWLTILSSDYARIAWTIELGDCQVVRTPGPGERMIIEVRVIERSALHACFRGKGMIGGEEAIRVDAWRAELLPLEEYQDAGDLRVLYSEIMEAP